MGGVARARWTACALAAGLLAAGLLATGCGDSAGFGGAGVLTSSWGDPQNPLEPANTNEVQGGKVLDMIFRGLKKYDPRTGKAQNWLARSIDTTDSRNFTIRVKDGWTFSNGEKVTARSFVDAWNYGASLRNNQKNAYFFAYIDGYDKVHPDTGAQSADTLSGLKVTGPLTFTVRLNQKFSSFPDTLGYAAFAPLPRAFFTDHAAWLKKPVGNGPYRIESYARGSAMNLRRWDGYPGPDRARNLGVTLLVYTDSNTAYTDVLVSNLDLVDDVPATQLKNVRTDLNGRYINTPTSTSCRPSPFPTTTPGGTPAARARSAPACPWRSTAGRSPRPSSGAPAPRPPTGPPRSSARPHGYKPGLCGHACDYDPVQARKLIQEGGGIPGGRLKITYNADTGSHKQWVDAVCNSINNALGDDKACVGNPVGTFADFRNQIGQHKMTGPFE